MKARTILGAGAVILFACGAMGQTPVIDSFQGNGLLTWSNGLNTQAVYRVEWAPEAGGPWSQTFQSLRTVDAQTNTSFTVKVPMFFRVVMVTNEPPVGMVWIDAGEFLMGDSAGVGEADELPVHKDYLSGFWMDETEVSKALWDSVFTWATNNGYTFGNPGSGKTNNHPVHTISWFDAVKWCNARSQREGLTPCYYESAALTAVHKTGQLDIANDWVRWDANGYRLPTEAEWEKAARGGHQGRSFPWGADVISHSQANYYSTNLFAYDVSPTSGFHPEFAGGGYPYTSPTASFPANGYGLHDMAGNVQEWCWDWYGAYSAATQTNPHGPTSGTYRVVRGGCWPGWSTGPRVSYRIVSTSYDRGTGDWVRGFRTVRAR